MMSIQNHIKHRVEIYFDISPNLIILVFVEVIKMMNKPTHVRCINTPNGSTTSDTSITSACKLNILKIN